MTKRIAPRRGVDMEFVEHFGLLRMLDGGKVIGSFNKEDDGTFMFEPSDYHMNMYQLKAAADKVEELTDPDGYKYGYT
jgi:hypothetical protein